MKNLAFVLVVISLLAVSQAGQAANLSSDWYVKLGTVGVSGYTPGVGPWDYDWDFTSPLGTVGPFLVTQPDPLWPQRLVSVQNVDNVPSGTAVDLYGQLRYALPADGIVTGMDFGYQTYYDASQMRLDLYITHSDGTTRLAYSETRSVPISTFCSASLSPGDTFYFRVTTVPEPSSLLILSLSVVSFIGFGWRRTK